MSVATALENSRKITVKELFEMDLEEGYFYELINGNIVKKQAPSPSACVRRSLNNTRLARPVRLSN